MDYTHRPAILENRPESLQKLIAQLERIPPFRLRPSTGKSDGYIVYCEHYNRHHIHLSPDDFAFFTNLQKREQQLVEQISSMIAETPAKEQRRLWQKIAAQRRKVGARLVSMQKPFSAHYQFYTEHNDYVASKSEVIISQALMREHLRFHYERPLALSPSHIIRPDFTIIHNGHEYIVEHFGLMSRDEYARVANSKRELYRELGFVEGVDILYTCEDETRGLDRVKEQIHAFADAIRAQAQQGVPGRTIEQRIEEYQHRRLMQLINDDENDIRAWK